MLPSSLRTLKLRYHDADNADKCNKMVEAAISAKLFELPHLEDLRFHVSCSGPSINIDPSLLDAAEKVGIQVGIEADLSKVR